MTSDRDLLTLPHGRCCGQSPTGAECMYRGPMFRAARRASITLALGGGLELILSTRYRLLRIMDRVEPYDLSLGQHDAVGAAQIHQQAAAGLLGVPKVIVLASAEYADLCRQVRPDAACPLVGVGPHRPTARSPVDHRRIRQPPLTPGAPMTL
ncbi:DUF6884 domain-containing protein [Actinomadura geliboluensis]|uniref:DUF6884 domain-containing protein n=1 Tax=Actinomadura geliboluensis TaxID=882440 RepID=UPI0037116D72